MRTGLTISGAGHAAVLLWSVLTFAVRPHKVASAAPVEDPTAKLAKQEIKAATDAPPVPPIPEAKPPEPKVNMPAQPPPDLIAEALKKDQDKKPEPKRTDARTPAPPKKPAQPEPPQFDSRKIEALLDKRIPQH